MAKVNWLGKPYVGSPRLAFFTDGSWKKGNHLAGAGISYQRCLDDRQWIDTAYVAEYYFDNHQCYAVDILDGSSRSIT